MCDFLALFYAPLTLMWHVLFFVIYLALSFAPLTLKWHVLFFVIIVLAPLPTSWHVLCTRSHSTCNRPISAAPLTSGRHVHAVLLAPCCCGL